jgi:hypothetical protein
MQPHAMLVRMLNIFQLLCTIAVSSCFGTVWLLFTRNECNGYNKAGDIVCLTCRQEERDVLMALDGGASRC